jgi:hypothetical protein
MAEKLIGYGSKIRRGDGATPEVFTDVVQAYDISPPKPTVDEVDVTNLDSLNQAKEFIAGLIDYGECTFMVVYDPAEATHVELRNAVGNMDAACNHQILYPDTGGTTETFEAWVKGFEPGMPIGDKLTASITLRVTGASTFA